MLIENAPELVDTRRAMALLRFCVPGQLDIAGINAVFDEISQDGRSGQCLLALATICHGHVPNLRTPEALQALQTTVQDLRVKEMENE
jgi:hypothetical protein